MVTQWFESFFGTVLGDGILFVLFIVAAFLVTGALGLGAALASKYWP